MNDDGVLTMEAIVAPSRRSGTSNLEAHASSRRRYLSRRPPGGSAEIVAGGERERKYLARRARHQRQILLARGFFPGARHEPLAVRRPIQLTIAAIEGVRGIDSERGRHVRPVRTRDIDAPPR